MATIYVCISGIFNISVLKQDMVLGAFSHFPQFFCRRFATKVESLKKEYSIQRNISEWRRDMDLSILNRTLPFQLEKEQGISNSLKPKRSSRFSSTAAETPLNSPQERLNTKHSSSQQFFLCCNNPL